MRVDVPNPFDDLPPDERAMLRLLSSLDDEDRAQLMRHMHQKLDERIRKIEGTSDSYG